MASLPFSAIVPARTDRATFVGQTGSGKTFLAAQLCSTRPFVVVYDPKGRIDWPGYVLHTRLESCVREAAPRIIYRPTYEDVRDPVEVDKFFEWIYLRHNTTLYVDELYAIARGDIYPLHYGACLTRGRELGVETWTATQRPAYIPGISLSEAEHLYVFKLKLGRDQQKIEEQTGIAPDAIRALPKWQFFYAPQEGEAIGPLRASARAPLGAGAATDAA